jgi:hypothetical protein
MAIDFLLHLCEAHRITPWGRIFSPAPRVITWTGTIAEKFSRCVSLPPPPPPQVVADSPPKWHDAVLVTRFDLQAPNSGGRTSETRTICWPSRPSISPTIPTSSLGSGIAYNYRGATLSLPARGATGPKVLDNEKKKRIGCLEELFDPKAIEASDAEALDNDSRLLEELEKHKTVPADIQRRSVMKTLC